MQLPISLSSYIIVPLPQLIVISEDIDRLRTNICLQQHNMLIYHLTLGHRPLLPAYFLHDPADPNPPLTFSSSNPRWVESQARKYALARLRTKVSSVVGIYVDIPSDGIYMIATFFLPNSLFVPLANRIPLSHSNMFYSSIQLTNTRITLGDRLPYLVRFSDQHEYMLDLVVQSRDDVTFSQLSHEQRTTWFGWCQSSLEQ